jgi:hypothetical protein
MNTDCRADLSEEIHRWLELLDQWGSKLLCLHFPDSMKDSEVDTGFSLTFI